MALKVIIYIFAVLALLPNFVYGNFTSYAEINIGETIQIEGYPKITLLSTKVSYYGSLADRIGAAEVRLKIDNQEICLPVSYEQSDVVVKGIRIGAEVIKDYE